MKRPALVVVVNVLQSLLGVVLAALTIYLLALTRSPETLAEPDAADTIHGLRIGALVLGIPAVITLVGIAGLWRSQFWGWVLSLATDVGMIAVLVYSVINDHDFDGVMSALVVTFVGAAVVLMLPQVRAFYWRPPDSRTLSS